MLVQILSPLASPSFASFFMEVRWCCNMWPLHLDPQFSLCSQFHFVLLPSPLPILTLITEGCHFLFTYL